MRHRIAYVVLSASVITLLMACSSPSNEVRSGPSGPKSSLQDAAEHTGGRQTPTDYFAGDDVALWHAGQDGVERFDIEAGQWTQVVPPTKDTSHAGDAFMPLGDGRLAVLSRTCDGVCGADDGASDIYTVSAGVMDQDGNHPLEIDRTITASSPIVSVGVVAEHTARFLVETYVVDVSSERGGVVRPSDPSHAPGLLCGSGDDWVGLAADFRDPAYVPKDSTTGTPVPTPPVVIAGAGPDSFEPLILPDDIAKDLTDFTWGRVCTGNGLALIGPDRADEYDLDTKRWSHVASDVGVALYGQSHYHPVTVAPDSTVWVTNAQGSTLTRDRAGWHLPFGERSASQPTSVVSTRGQLLLFPSEETRRTSTDRTKLDPDSFGPQPTLEGN